MTFQRTIENITLGTPVFSQEGEQLGTVKELRGTAFKVDASMKPDYWLPASCLAEGGTGRLTVAARKDRIGDLKVDEPKAR